MDTDEIAVGLAQQWHQGNRAFVREELTSLPSDLRMAVAIRLADSLLPKPSPVLKALADYLEPR